MFGRRLKTIVCAMAISAGCRMIPAHHHATGPSGLSVQPEVDRVVFAWNGPVVAPMRDDIASALATYQSDPRPFVMRLDSPGGSVAEGHAVMAAIRAAAQWHRIDTRVERGAICASMCVPIFLLGTERSADPAAQFMFHEVKIVVPAKDKGKDRDGAAGAETAYADQRSRKAVETLVTDVFYEADVGAARVSPSWLRQMRARIVGHDVWASAQRLVDDRAGIVDALAPTGAR